MRNEKRAGGRLARMRALYARLCGGWGGRTAQSASALKLPGLPVTSAPVPAPQARHARAAKPPRGRTGAIAPVARGAAETVRSHLAADASTKTVQGLGTVSAYAKNSDATYGLRGLAGMQPNAVNGGVSYGLRGLAGMQPNAVNGGVTYGLRGLAEVQSNAANGGATYGLRGLAGVQSNAAIGGAAHGLRRWSGIRRFTPPRLLRQTALLPTHTRGGNPANGWRELAGATAAQTAARSVSSHETFGLHGLAGLRPAQPSLPGTPPVPPPRIPSPPPAIVQSADAAAAQVQVYVTNNCKIETPVDYQTVWDKLEDALRESLNVVAAGG